jgi:type VI secretion system protein ImpJ
MSFEAKVVWSEGMFLRTQHFQQQDRYVEGLVRAATRGLTGHGFGFRSLRLNAGLLATGKVAIAEADGILPDGTPFSIPDTADHPAPIELDTATREGVIYLAVPEQQPGAVAIDPMGAPDSGAPFRGQELEVRDAIAGAEGRAPIEVAKLRFRLLHESGDRAGYVGLGTAKVTGIQPDGAVILDNDYIPPCLTVGASQPLKELLAELDGKLEGIAQDRVGYVLDPRARGTAEVQDLFILQFVNRIQPVARHLHQQHHVHPEELFAWLVSVVGEAATFGASERRPPELPVYRHTDLQATFRPVIDLLRRLLAEIARPDRKAVPVPLRVHRTGVRTTEVADMRLFSDAAFVLAVTAALPAERIRQLFPRQTKIGPIEELQDLVVSALSGIEATPLPVAPRQVPYHAGMIYFELDRSSPYWRKLASSSGLAIHVTGEFPELDMECWAIRD